MPIDLINTGKQALAIIGALVVLLTFFNLLISLVPKLSGLKAKALGYLSDSFNFIFLRRAAVKSDIENTVNSVVFELQKELPKGWIKKASIQWVRNLERKDKAVEGELILRIRPVSGEETNLIYAVTAFFDTILFPDTNKVIPSRKMRASSLLVSRRALVQKNSSFKDLFNKTQLEDAIQADDKFIHDFTKFEKLDNLGFFTGAFLREMHTIAERSLYNEMRTGIEKELNQVLEHMCTFVRELCSEKGQVTDESKWSRTGPVTSYAFLLVARPNNSGTKGYVEKAKSRKIEGVDRLYILAREEQKHFAKQVVNEIAKSGEYKIEDTFTLTKDYRCNNGGYGAILVTETE